MFTFFNHSIIYLFVCIYIYYMCIYIYYMYIYIYIYDSNNTNNNNNSKNSNNNNNNNKNNTNNGFTHSKTTEAACQVSSAPKMANLWTLGTPPSHGSKNHLRQRQIVVFFVERGWGNPQNFQTQLCHLKRGDAHFFSWVEISRRVHHGKVFIFGVLMTVYRL